MLALSLGFIAAPVAVLFGDVTIQLAWLAGSTTSTACVGTSTAGGRCRCCFVAGVLLLFVTLHLARGIGYLHGQLAKHMLVKIGAVRLTAVAGKEKPGEEMPAFWCGLPAAAASSAALPFCLAATQAVAYFGDEVAHLRIHLRRASGGR